MFDDDLVYVVFGHDVDVAQWFTVGASKLALTGEAHASHFFFPSQCSLSPTKLGLPFQSQVKASFDAPTF